MSRCETSLIRWVRLAPGPLRSPRRERLSDGSDRPMSVELGMFGDKTVQVVSGLEERDQVVLPAAA